MPKHQNYNIAPKLPQYSIEVQLTLHNGCCIDNVSAMFKSRRQVNNVNTKTSNSQCSAKVDSTLDSKFTTFHGCYNTSVIVQRSNCDV